MIRELWCINEGGILLFHYSKNKEEKKRDNDLISGFFNSIENIFKIYIKEPVTCIKLEKHYLLFHRKKNLTFIAKIPNSYEYDYAQSYLNSIAERFFSLHNYNTIKDFNDIQTQDFSAILNTP